MRDLLDRYASRGLEVFAELAWWTVILPPVLVFAAIGALHAWVTGRRP